ncbi:hypothetical protein D9M69_407790 [compost metagenome]
MLAFGVVAEVVRFVDDDQVEVAPVERCQVDAIHAATVTGQVCVREHGIGEAIFEEGVEFAVVLGEIDRPVVAQLLGAEHQYAVVAQFVVLDDRQRRVGFAQAHAVGQDAAVVLVDLVDGAFDAIFLEVEQSLPDVSVDDGGLVEQRGVGFLPGQEALEDVVERLKVDELRRMIDVKLL